MENGQQDLRRFTATWKPVERAWKTPVRTRTLSSDQNITTISGFVTVISSHPTSSKDTTLKLLHNDCYEGCARESLADWTSILQGRSKCFWPATRTLTQLTAATTQARGRGTTAKGFTARAANPMETFRENWTHEGDFGRTGA